MTDENEGLKSRHGVGIFTTKEAIVLVLVALVCLLIPGVMIGGLLYWFGLISLKIGIAVAIVTPVIIGLVIKVVSR